MARLLNVIPSSSEQLPKFERDLLIECTNSGIKRAKAEGKKFSRPPALTNAQQSDVLRLLAEAMPVTQVARQFETTRQTIMRIRGAAKV